MVAGKEQVMAKIMDPEHPAVHGGTFSGNLIGAAAALSALDIMSAPGFYPNLFATADLLFAGLQELFDEIGIPARVQHLGSSFGIYFGTTEAVTDYRQFKDLDWNLSRLFFRRCIEEGLYFQTDLTVSAAHTAGDIDRTLDTIRRILKDPGLRSSA